MASTGRVPSSVAVVGPVTLAWIRPGATVEETAEIATPTPAGADNVYAHEIPTPETGSWLGRCRLTVEAQDVALAPEMISTDCPFAWPPDPAENKALVFVVEPNPVPPPSSRVVCQGLQTA